MDPVRADRPYQTIATDDIGAFVALAFERPAEFIGKELEMAGSELTNPEAAKVFSRDLGKPVKFQKLPLLHFRLVCRRIVQEPRCPGGTTVEVSRIRLRRISGQQEGEKNPKSDYIMIR